MSGISTQPPSNKDEIIGSTFSQACLQISIPTPRHKMYIQHDTLSISPHIPLHMI